MTLSLPSLSASGGGSAPAAVTLSGQWDGEAEAAQLSWTASSAANFQEYSLRMTAGPTYDAANETVVDTFSAGILSAETSEGLAMPGDSASFKVYVVTDTGSETGSNTITITRP
jgi:hypothetical protein